jgi:hypothetical protein
MEILNKKKKQQCNVEVLNFNGRLKGLKNNIQSSFNATCIWCDSKISLVFYSCQSCWSIVVDLYFLKITKICNNFYG